MESISTLQDRLNELMNDRSINTEESQDVPLSTPNPVAVDAVGGQGEWSVDGGHTHLF